MKPTPVLILNRSRQRSPQSTHFRSPRRRFVCSPHSPRPPDPFSNRTETFDPLEPPPGFEEPKISSALLIQAQGEARPKGTQQRTHRSRRPDEAAQSHLGLSANRAADCLGFRHPHRQRRGSKDSRPSLPTGTGLGWSILADLHWTPERQPLESRSVPVRIGHVADPLGPGRHGSIYPPDHWVRRPCRNRRWCRTLPDVQPRHSGARCYS